MKINHSFQINSLKNDLWSFLTFEFLPLQNSSQSMSSHLVHFICVLSIIIGHQSLILKHGIKRSCCSCVIECIMCIPYFIFLLHTIKMKINHSFQINSLKNDLWSFLTFEFLPLQNSSPRSGGKIIFKRELIWNAPLSKIYSCFLYVKYSLWPHSKRNYILELSFLLRYTTSLSTLILQDFCKI
jgi:hypothetical protein